MSAATRLAHKRWPKVPVICMQCVLDDEQGEIEALMTPEQKREVRASGYDPDRFVDGEGNYSVINGPHGPYLKRRREQ
jgi:hypothetical protein